jgi:ribosome-binding factor A
MLREKQLPQYIQSIVGEYFLRNLELSEGVLLTVTKVEVSPDRLHAKAWISILPENRAEECLPIIKHHLYGVQKAINKKVQTRPTPRLSVEIDNNPSYSSHIEELLKKIDE